MFTNSLSSFVALATLALGQSLATGAGGTINSPTFNETLKTCENILFPINITGIPSNVALITLQMVGSVGFIPPTYNWDGDVFIPVNGTVIDSIPWPSQFQDGSADSGNYFIEVNEWAVNCSTGTPFRYTLQTQINAINNGFDESDCQS